MNTALDQSFKLTFCISFIKTPSVMNLICVSGVVFPSNRTRYDTLSVLKFSSLATLSDIDMAAILLGSVIPITLPLLEKEEKNIKIKIHETLAQNYE